MIQTKANSTELDNIRSEISRISCDCNSRAQTMGRDLDSVMTQMGQKVDNVLKELILKASLKDLLQLLDQKVNVSDVNTALQTIEKEMTNFVKQTRLKELLDDQSLVTEALCAENCVARWVWKTGELLHAG